MEENTANNVENPMVDKILKKIVRTIGIIYAYWFLWSSGAVFGIIVGAHIMFTIELWIAVIITTIFGIILIREIK